MMKIKRENEITYDSRKLENEMKSEQYDKLKSEVESLKKEIEQKIRERKLLNKDVVTAEEQEK